jgi:2-polyprenyl-6-methoxyphenol hydroxylase-like FAD-dependent oxidoreductase
MRSDQHYDVLIIGAGLAGLALARQLLLNTDKRILLVDRRSEFPPAKQKVGEATVQLSAYYLAKVLDLEEHLLREHFLKYNLRFYWKTPGLANDCYEHYSQAYILKLSNINTYQLDRNKLEGEMLRLNFEHPNFTFESGVKNLDVKISETGGPHSFSFNVEQCAAQGSAGWIVDTSGRGKFLARRLGLTRESPIRHGAHFFWVEGLLNIEKLTSLTQQQIRTRPDRAQLGHLPVWLSTNHFCGEGFWFWTIPLHGKTSLGLVYDSQIFPRERVDTLEKLIAWVCEEFPLFDRDLPQRRVLHHTALKDFAYDCAQTINPARWAIAGEAGRFTDPLYSPGGDLISFYNTFITDAIRTGNTADLRAKCEVYEQLMQAVYQAYVPSYAISYDTLGDQECFTMKYSWELAIYFAFFVFPFINDLFTERRFIIPFVQRFAQLGPINKNLQVFISAYYQWKKTARGRPSKIIYSDFTEMAALFRAEKTFYHVGVSVEEARIILDQQLGNLKEMARFIVVHISAAVLGDECALINRSFVAGFDLNRLRFDPSEIRARYAACKSSSEIYNWSFDPDVLRRFEEDVWSNAVQDECATELLAGVGGD